jgi:small-conductance mechanosensitive channel
MWARFRSSSRLIIGRILLNDRFLETQKLYQVVDFESYLFIILLGLSAYLFYKFLLKNVSAERHQNIQNHLKNLAKYALTFSVFFGAYWTLQQSSDMGLKSLLPYLAFASFSVGALCFVRTCHLLVLQYLFLGSMRTGVPLLIVNIFSLVLSIILGFWTVNNIFGVHLAPLVATSAAFSIILGLALQDTLGNLFAGISLQIDHTFEIGNWVEIMNGNTLIVGQVKELSWRSTVMLGFSDELITLPNKLVASSQISNFSPDSGPIMRTQTFKFPHGAKTASILEVLEMAAAQISDIRALPAPLAYVREANENHVVIRLLYFIDDYGRQFLIGDKVITKSLEALEKNGIQTARPILNITRTEA